jgi:hypothetical protein
MDPVIDNLKRIQTIILQATSLPVIDRPPDDWKPTIEDLATRYAQLAIAYATSTALLQQTIPLLVEEMHAIRDEVRVHRRAKSLKRRTG